MPNWVREYQERAALRANRAVEPPFTAFICEVKSYRPSDGTVVVTNYIRSDVPQELGPMPYMMALTGVGYGQQTFPEVGVQVLVLCLTPDSDEYVCLGGLYNSVETVALSSLLPGEWYAESKTGQAFKLDVTAQAALIGAIATITGNPYRVLREKDLYPLVTALNALVSALNSHQHTGVQTGSGTSGAPSSSFSTFSNPAGSNTAKAGD